MVIYHSHRQYSPVPSTYRTQPVNAFGTHETSFKIVESALSGFVGKLITTLKWFMKPVKQRKTFICSCKIFYTFLQPCEINPYATGTLCVYFSGSWISVLVWVSPSLVEEWMTQWSDLRSSKLLKTSLHPLERWSTTHLSLPFARLPRMMHV